MIRITLAMAAAFFVTGGATIAEASIRPHPISGLAIIAEAATPPAVGTGAILAGTAAGATTYASARPAPATPVRQ